MKAILPDLLAPNLKIVFCGTAAGNKSAERKAYYAGAGNLFYHTLASSGFTPRILKPEDFPERGLYFPTLNTIYKLSEILKLQPHKLIEKVDALMKN
jgi:G:T/U-mismatch repair DNA glycosylase